LNSAYIWIFFPAVVALILLLVQRRATLVAITGTATAAGLAGLAIWLPAQEQIFIWRWVIPFEESFNILGRSLILSGTDRPSLVIIYLTAALWFGAASFVRPNKLFVPLGLGLVALLTAAIAVEPFLFAAIFIEIAVLVSIPFLSPPGNMVGKGVLRYFSFQTIGMPFILISGLMFTGFEVGPGPQNFVIIAVASLAIGFALLLAIFPFHTWIPMLAQESHPYSTAFVYLILPIAITLLGLGFLDNFTWMKEDPGTSILLRSVGGLMVVMAGFWAAAERNLARLMGFALIMDIGFSLVAIGLASGEAYETYRGIFFDLLLPRGLSLGIWALALSGLIGKVETFDYKDLRGIAQRYPIISTSVILAIFCLAGVPLLASFPMRLGLITGLSLNSTPLAIWVIIGSLGLLVAGIRALIYMIMDVDHAGWGINESWLQIIFLAVGGLILFVLGLFPHLFRQILVNVPAGF
jgi:NADH:ubiquinone oxidoreductase subunit 2 (subunit N)